MRAWQLAIVLAGCGRVGFGGGDDEAASDFAVRSRLDLDRATIDEDLTDFPLLVVLDAARFDAAAARPDLADLRFVTGDGTVLDHELEPSPVAGEVLAWVRVPSIPRNTHPTLWLYYGDPDATAQAGAVWSATYAGVWHLADGGDASPAANDAVAMQATAVTGWIGSGMSFAPTGAGHLAVADDPTLHWPSSALTASGWIKLRSYRQMSSALVARSRTVAGIENDFFLGISSQEAHAQMTLVGAGATLLNAPEQAPLDAWLHLALVYDGATMVLYVDGVEVATIALAGTMGSAARPVYVGADCNNGGAMPNADYVDGSVDEVRLESIARTPGWIAADHAAMTDAWITYGPIERL